MKPYNPTDPVPFGTDLADLARARADYGAEHGMPIEPWMDPERQFVLIEASQELADAENYLDWDVIQARAAGEDSGEYRIEMTLARLNLRNAFIHALRAAAIRDRSRSVQGINFPDVSYPPTHVDCKMRCALPPNGDPAPAVDGPGSNQYRESLLGGKTDGSK